MKKNGVIANISYGQDGRVCKYKDKEGKDRIIILKKGRPRDESDYLYYGVSKELNSNLDMLLREAINQKGITPNIQEDYRKALKLHNKIAEIALEYLNRQDAGISDKTPDSLDEDEYVQ